MARMDMNNPAVMSDKELELMKSDGVNPTMPVEEGMLDNPSLPIMSEEDKELFRTLSDMGIPDIEIIDIMANAKVGEAVESAANAGINPAEFGGLPKTGSSPAGNPSMQTSPATGNPTSMNQNDMAMYLQNKVAEIKGRTGGSAGMGALSGVPAGNQIPMPKPRPAVIPQRLGADRTFNPTDQLTPNTALNT